MLCQCGDVKVLRVATYNLYLGADLTLIFGARDPAHLLTQARIVHEQLLATDFHARAESVARMVIRERVDVLGLQEVAQWRRAAMDPHGIVGRPTIWCDFLDELLGALDRAGTSYDAHGLNSNFHGGAVVSDSESLSVVGYNVILVRRGSSVAVTGTATGSFAAALDIHTEMDDLVLNVQRSWGWIDARVDGAAFRFVNTHLEAYDAETRRAQRDQMLSLVGEHSTPVLLVGDFNASPEEVGMPSTYVDAWTGSGGDPRGGHTCGQAADLANEKSLLAQRIDYVWVRGARVKTCEVVGNTAADRTTAANLWPSDHACVVAAVSLGPLGWLHQSTGLLRSALVWLRRFFPANRRSRAPREGLVGRRFGAGGASALLRTSTSLARAASRFRCCDRYSEAEIVRTPATSR